MQDTVFIDELGHFDRERIPERVVHAKGGGAFGYFEVTHDISKYTKAVVFEKIGKRTPVVINAFYLSRITSSSSTIKSPNLY